MKNIFFKLSSLEILVSGDSNEDRLLLFNRVKKYVYSGDYSTYRDVKKYLKYAHLDDATVASKMGIKESAVRQIRMRVSREATNAIGEDLLNVVEFGDAKQLKIALRDFSFIEKNLTSRDLFLPDIIRMINDCQVDEDVFEVGDCKYELTLLHWLCSDKIKELMTNVDISRLGYLLRVLDGKEGTRFDKANVLRVIQSDDLVRHAKPEDRSKFTFPPVRPEDEF